MTVTQVHYTNAVLEPRVVPRWEQLMGIPCKRKDEMDEKKKNSMNYSISPSCLRFLSRLKVLELMILCANGFSWNNYKSMINYICHLLYIYLDASVNVITHFLHNE